MLAYLDHHATTPCDPAVVAAMAPWWSEHCANPANRLYRPALEAAAAVERARGQLARVLGSRAETVIFTSGATEANNLALKGVCEAALAAGNPRRRLVSLVSEHRAVLDPLAYLGSHGFPVSLVPIQPDGLVDLAQLEAALGDDVLLLSVMAANNEIGVLQPLAAIAALCRQRGVLLHVDAAQAAGHIPLAIEELGIDLLSLSGHKFYGPKGVGALLVRPGLQLAAQLHGGGQQDGRRAGTLPVPLVVGLGEALLRAEADRAERAGRLARGPTRAAAGPARWWPPAGPAVGPLSGGEPGPVAGGPRWPGQGAAGGVGGAGGDVGEQVGSSPVGRGGGAGFYCADARSLMG